MLSKYLDPIQQLISTADNVIPLTCVGRAVSKALTVGAGVHYNVPQWGIDALATKAGFIYGSVNDTAAGTGLRTARIHGIASGLVDNFIEVTEDHTFTAGQSAPGSVVWQFVNCIEALTTGSLRQPDFTTYLSMVNSPTEQDLAWVEGTVKEMPPAWLDTSQQRFYNTGNMMIASGYKFLLQKFTVSIDFAATDGATKDGVFAIMVGEPGTATGKVRTLVAHAEIPEGGGAAVWEPKTPLLIEEDNYLIPHCISVGAVANDVYTCIEGLLIRTRTGTS